MRILGIDYGTARVGIALSDELGILASPRAVLPYSKAVIEQIADIVRREEVGSVVIGMPYGLKGETTESTERTKRFAEKLRAALPCPVVEWDESFSSRRAVARMVEAGVRKSQRRKKENTDAWAAAVVLQEYLESGQNSK